MEKAIFSLREKCPISEFLWSVFSGIRTKYGEIRSISPYSALLIQSKCGKMRTRKTPNTDTFQAFFGAVKQLKSFIKQDHVGNTP